METLEEFLEYLDTLGGTHYNAKSRFPRRLYDESVMELESMNITDITQAILKKSKPGTIFFHIEHDSEEEWIGKWKEESNIELDVYIRTYKGLPELADRDHTAPNGGHHLMIWKNK